MVERVLEWTSGSLASALPTLVEATVDPVSCVLLLHTVFSHSLIVHSYIYIYIYAVGKTPVLVSEFTV